MLEKKFPCWQSGLWTCHSVNFQDGQTNYGEFVTMMQSDKSGLGWQTMESSMNVPLREAPEVYWCLCRCKDIRYCSIWLLSWWFLSHRSQPSGKVCEPGRGECSLNSRGLVERLPAWHHAVMQIVQVCCMIYKNRAVVAIYVSVTGLLVATPAV